jgi:predicted nucleic acid-binding Zn ribbon protein
MRRGRERPIADAVMRLAESLAPQTPLSKIKRAWPEVVGKPMAAHSKPAQLKGSLLTVECSGSVYAQELELQSRRVLTKLAEELSAQVVEKIRFVVADQRRRDSRIP